MDLRIKILEEKTSIEQIKKLAEIWFGSMIKGCVDIDLERVAIGGDYHIESSELLSKTGSKFENIWGFNIRFEENPDGVLEFDLMVNIKPNFGNRSRNVGNSEIVARATEIIKKFITIN